MVRPDDDAGAPRSILKELVVNQYQAILLGGAALASLVSLNPAPLLVWLGGELVLLPILDTRPLRLLAHRRRMKRSRQSVESQRAQLVGSLQADNQRRYREMEILARHIESNYQGLHGVSQAYLAEQRDKLDVILNSVAHRMVALERYGRLLASRNRGDLEAAIARLETELAGNDLGARARAALEKNLELKQRLLASFKDATGTIKALAAELDSMGSLLDVLHQNSISMRDPQAASQELDTIVRQSEDSERVVREMEALLHSDAEWSAPPPPLPGVPPLPEPAGAPRKAKQR